MPETTEEKQGDVRIYIVSTLFFVCIFAGGTLLCLYMLEPEAKWTAMYPIIGIVLIGIPWMFWIVTYIYRCIRHCFCVSNGGGDVKRELSSLTKRQSCASEGHPGKSMHLLSENEGSPLGTPNGCQRQVHFGDVIVLQSSECNQDEHSGETPREDTHHHFSGIEHEGEGSSHDCITSDEDHISAASRRGEEPLIMA